MNGGITSRTIDALRFPCAVLIVFIHVFQVRPEIGAFPFSFSDTVQIALSQGICRIAVPIFFLISGYLFFSKLDEWDWNTYYGKLRKRVKTLLVPYLLWITLAILVEFSLSLFRYRFYGGASPFELLSNYGWGWMYWNCARHFVSFEKSILGWAIPSAYPFDFPLWFIRDLIVLCVFTPVIHFLIRKTRGWILALLYPLFLLQIWIPLEGFSAEGWFFFTLGSTLRIYGKDLVAFFRPFRIPSCLVSAVALFLCIRTYGNNEAWGYAKRFLTLPGSIAAIQIVSALLTKDIWKESAFLSECSFPVFAAHTIRLPFLTGLILDRIIPGHSGTGFLVKYLIQPVLIVAIIVLAFRLAKRFFPRTTALFTGYRVVNNG
jgi:fucose 4-O-acetylase-like acetyltransferase